MARRRKKSLSVGWILALVLAAFGAAAAVTYYVTKDSVDSGPGPVSKPHVSGPVQRPAAAARQVTIFVPEVAGGRFYLVPTQRKTNVKGDLLDAAMEALLATTREGGEAGKLIPQGTELLAPVKVSGQTAVVDLSREFLDNFSGGSIQEALTLNAIAHTVVSNSEGRASAVRILVEGKAAETLGGHFGLDEPISPDGTLLKSGESD